MKGTGVCWFVLGGDCCSPTRARRCPAIPALVSTTIPRPHSPCREQGAANWPHTHPDSLTFQNPRINLSSESLDLILFPELLS